MIRLDELRLQVDLADGRMVEQGAPLRRLTIRRIQGSNDIFRALAPGSCCSVSAASASQRSGAEEIARAIAAFPNLVVRGPQITNPIERRVAGLEPHPQQAVIDAGIAFNHGFRDSGGDDDELWGYTAQPLTELRLSAGHTTCECSAPQPGVHALALMHRALQQDRARWLKRVIRPRGSRPGSRVRARSCSSA